MAVDFKNLSIKQLRAELQQVGSVPTRTLLALRRDRRQGVRALVAQLEKRAAAERRERYRIRRMLRGERDLWRAGWRYIAGVDEVGVGPLAGPVVAAAVVFGADISLTGVNDSKCLDPETRTKLAAVIRDRAIGVGVGTASVDEIDRLNVYHAGLLAMRRAIEALPVVPEQVLVDARAIPDLPVPQRAIIRGDETCFSIAAASIVAKVHRDRLMADLDRRYPQYGFCRHKGYATAEHQAAVRRYGPCELHRQSYAFLQELRGRYSQQFYELRERLVGKPGAVALQAVARELRGNAACLSEPERRKLKLLLARREALL